MTIKDDEFIMYLIVLVAGITVMYFLWRWIFSVDKQLRHQKTMILLLLMLVEKQGGETDTTQKIKEDLEK